MNNLADDKSLGEVHESVDTTAGHRPMWRRIFFFFGPAYLVSGLYGPCNWATDLAGGKPVWIQPDLGAADE